MSTTKPLVTDDLALLRVEKQLLLELLAAAWSDTKGTAIPPEALEPEIRQHAMKRLLAGVQVDGISPN